MIIIYAGSYDNAQVAGTTWYVLHATLIADIRHRALPPHKSRKHFIIRRAELEDVLRDAKMAFVFKQGRYRGHSISMERLKIAVDSLTNLLSTKYTTFKIKGLT